ncbi:MULTISPECIES: hypothetical protein [Ruminococcus]|uniref:Uncharacterized protein n=1 Tax=Ruminococcus flavefaciens TaxID=1265 RepID=A0A1M7M446_RUMFL|nr:MULTISPECIES: hypothetical protein [Ruminococcus]MCR4796343.1 hypothetical protein [Ruminococcus sp.]SHM85432.1 hypothetical protein SAMN04487860_11848 [Ruminococcus flavefaciens]
MEFQKDIGMFHIEGGSMKTAGKGNLGVTEEVPQNIRTKTDIKHVAKTAAKAAALTGVFLLKHKFKSKKK